MPRSKSKSGGSPRRNSKRVTFRDLSHHRRKLTVGKHTLTVERGRVTVSEPDVVEALDERGDFAREES